MLYASSIENGLLTNDLMTLVTRKLLIFFLRIEKEYYKSLDKAKGLSYLYALNENLIKSDIVKKSRNIAAVNLKQLWNRNNKSTP